MRHAGRKSGNGREKGEAENPKRPHETLLCTEELSQSLEDTQAKSQAKSRGLQK